jgi:uncharacterized membrane protein
MLIPVATGYGLYYVSNEKLRADISVWHWAIGSLLALMLVIHIALGRRARENSQVGTVTAVGARAATPDRLPRRGRRTCTDPLI